MIEEIISTGLTFLHDIPAIIWIVMLMVYISFAFGFHIFVLVRKNSKKEQQGENIMNYNVDENKEFIKTLLRNTGRRDIDLLIKYLEVTDYFTAPASTKYHLNRVGGLATHSLNMYDALSWLNEQYGKPLPDDSVIIISLLHDICKINTYKLTYKDNERIYIRDDDRPIGHGEKSLLIASTYIKLTPVEELLIRWHMGPYDPQFERNVKSIKKIFPYPKLAYIADDIAASIADEMFED